MARSALVLLLVSATTAAQEAVPRESRVEEILRILLRQESPGANLDYARRSVIKEGPSAIPGLFAVLKNDKASRSERFCAAWALTELDDRGEHARDLLTLLEQGKITTRAGSTSGGHIPGNHLGGFLNDEADFERVVRVAAKDDADSAFIAVAAFRRFPPDYQRRRWPGVLRNVKDVSTLHVALGDIQVDSEELRAALLVLARDKSRAEHIRRAAAQQWAERLTPKDFAQVADLFRKLFPEERVPSSHTLAVLAHLDWKRAQEEFTRHFADTRKKAAEKSFRDDPTIADFNPYKDVSLLGTEEQVQAIFGGLLDYAKKAGPRYDPSGATMHYLWELGYRDAAPLFLGDNRYPGREADAVYHRFGLDVRQLVAKALDEQPPWHSMRLAASDKLPVALILKHKKDFIDRCEKVLTSPSGSIARELDGGLDSRFAREEEFKREAFLILKRLAPKQAMLHEDAVKLDPLPPAPAEIGWRELATQFKQERNWAVRLALARRLLERSELLPADTSEEAVREAAGAMGKLIGDERLSLAALLAVHGHAEADAVLDSFRKGEWKPRDSHRIYYDLSRWTLTRAEPFAGRAQTRLLAALAGHADPNTQAAAVQIAERCLHLRNNDGKYPVFRAVLDLLRPESDWRVRAAAGFVLRRACKDLLPDWDYYHFWDRDRQAQAAATLRDWWRANEARVTWVPPADSVVGFGYFRIGG